MSEYEIPHDAELHNEVHKHIMNELKRVGVFSTFARGITAVNLIQSRHLCFKHAGRIHFISLGEIIQFCEEMTAKGFATAFTRFDIGVTLEVTESGFNAFIAPEKLQQQIKATSDQSSKDIVSGSMVFQKVMPGTLPPAKYLLLPILQALTSGPKKTKALGNEVTKLIGFPLTEAAKPIPPGSNASLRAHLSFCIDYLHRQGCLTRFAKKNVEITDFGKSQLRLQHKADWPNFKEPKVQINPIEQRKQLSEFMNVSKPRTVIQRLPYMSMAEIKSVWKNAIKLSSDAKTAVQNNPATLILSAIEAEWNRRSDMTRPGDFFKWPSTSAKSGNGTFALEQAEQEGMMAYLEYHVGKTSSASTKMRQVILARIFEGVLPPAFPRDYMEQWDKQSSPSRLRKMAASIAAFARNARRRQDGNLDEAIQHWEQDLQFLRERYYEGKFNFDWPATKID